MNYLDIYYRALVDYRKNTRDFRDCINQRSSTAKANAKDDTLTVIRKICTVNTDWVEAIEEGMVHVEKALREERQFIRSNGEIIDIEKVKNVSKDSVEHLARHSNLITRYEEGEDIVPDRLYTVERLSDFAVYENRFLYMLLCYLRDFITVRYNKILELEHTYNGKMSMNKTVVMTKRSISFRVELEEEKKDDIYLKKQSESRDIIVRIGNQLKLVLAFLATPLMQEVSKSPMLKPPITKTNVLRMNHNFRGALALYEYISAYDTPGYTVEERVQTQSPFRMDVADEMAELVLLSSFLAYEHGLSLKGELQLEYEREEERRRDEEKRRLLEQLRALKHRIRESGESPEEYMLMLERTNRMLREDSEALVVAKQEIDRLKAEKEALQRDKNSLIAQVNGLNEEIERLGREHEREIRELNEAHSAQIDEIVAQNLEERAEMRSSYEEKLSQEREERRSEKEELELVISNNRAEYEAGIESLKAECASQLNEMEAEQARVVDSIRAMWQAEVYQLKGVSREKDEEIRALNEQMQQLEERRVVSEARLTAMRYEHGLITPSEEFTSQEIFEEVEKQLDTLLIFFKKQWGITKKAIRRKAFTEFLDSIKEEKKAKKKKGEAAEAETDEAPIEEAPAEEAEAVEPRSEIAERAMIKMAELDMEAPVEEAPTDAPVEEAPTDMPVIEEAVAEEALTEETVEEPITEESPATEEASEGEKRGDNTDTEDGDGDEDDDKREE